MPHVIGVDFGGTNIKAGVVDVGAGRILHQDSVPTLARDGEAAVMERIAALVNRLAVESGIDCTSLASIGIGVPGVVDLEKGQTIFLPNLPGTWRNIPLAQVIGDRTGMRVGILNDARAITYGEWRFGAGMGARSMACFAIGTGVGGGLIIDRQLHLGLGGTAGELGHQTIDPNGPRCGCGNRGCLEAFASGPAIAAMGIKAVIQGLTTSLGGRVDFDLNRITVELIAEAARDGDEVCQEIFDRVGTCLGIAIANILVSTGPGKVVIAGGVASAFDLFKDSLNRTIAERVFVVPLDRVEILPARLGSLAGVMGVAAWVSE